MEMHTPKLAQYRVRGYQHEMFERSLQQNTIVVLDTGGGKTFIAALRIRAELERCAAEQMVWFLAPGVELCRQQHDALTAFIPSARVRLLIGSDNMDRWGERAIWDAALHDVRIVVSTHAVLMHALQHAFVSLSQLALLVFDEAHHCVKKHPGNIIMRDFYHTAKGAEDNEAASTPVHAHCKDGGRKVQLPHILGLSASLVMKSHLPSMQVIEKNLDSLSITPRLHRDELQNCVNRPTCVVLRYQPCIVRDTVVSGTAFQALTRAWHRSGTQRTTDGCRTTEHIWLQNRVHENLEQLREKAAYTNEILGSWSADHLIVETVRRLKDSIHGQDSFLADLTHDARYALLQQLSAVGPGATDFAHRNGDDFALSNKAECLINFLALRSIETTTAIIFVERRATTAALSHLLSVHPAVREKFRPAPFVGMSSSPSRKSAIGELLDTKGQQNLLQKFRSGEINLLVATNALEEGIDVQSCNLVVCFDPPSNLKSFIQRRGRARQEESTLAIMASVKDETSRVEKWQALEAELIRICQSDRQLAETSNAGFEEEKENCDLKLVHPETGAVITAESALPHLAHFCNSLPPQPYLDHRPEFTYATNGDGRITATVTLPSCLSASLRRFTSKQARESETFARNDAAWQAYFALYSAGLLNEHLLPLCQEWAPKADFTELEPGPTRICEETNVWETAEYPSSADCPSYQSRISMTEEQTNEIVSMTLLTVRPISEVPPILIRWSQEQSYRIEMADSEAFVAPDPWDLDVLRKTSLSIYKACRSNRLDVAASDLTIFLRPDEGVDPVEWLKKNGGSIAAMACSSDAIGTDTKIVRVPLPNQPPFVMRGWFLDGKNRPHLRAEALRCNNLLPSISSSMGGQNRSEEDAVKYPVFPAEQCEIDRMDIRYVRFSLCMSRVFGHINDVMIAQVLRNQVMRDIPLGDLCQTVAAIRAPCANRETNYQCYEFVGDAILKFIVSQFLYTSQPFWPEGFLSKRCAQLVCNERLAFEALRVGLDRFIITRSINHRQWTPPSKRSLSTSPGRTISNKVLADVVEALIGTSFRPGETDLDTARRCIHYFIPAVPLTYPRVEARSPMSETIKALVLPTEQLIGRNFKQKTLLLEALTLSSGASQFRTESYQRLEFLGDAVLDLIVVKRLLSEGQRVGNLNQGKLTRMRAALVNAHLLGYFNLHFCHLVQSPTVHTDADTGEFYVSTDKSRVSLWQFLRHDSAYLSAAQQECLRRYDKLSASLHNAIHCGQSYPWEYLSELHPAKFHSDMIESILGAIFVDCGETLQPCEQFLARIGLLGYLQRLVKENVNTVHPRDHLQQLLGSREVEYVVRRIRDKSFKGHLVLDGMIKATTEHCSSKSHVVAKLAVMGIGMLQDDRVSTGIDH